MKNTKLILWMLCFALVACGRPTPNHGTNPDAGGTDNNSGNTIQQSAVPVTGGQATSHDGIFSIAISPHTFDQLVTVSIEKLDDLPGSETRSIFGAYRVSLIPDTVALADNKTVRPQFVMSQEDLDAVELNNLRIVLRTDPETGFETQQEPRYMEGKVWSTSGILSADFGLIRTTEPDTCECNEDDSCSEGCACDPDCEDGPDPDPSDSGNPTNCSEGEFACHSGDQCIPQIYFCDGLPQCNDGSDETDNACNENTGPTADPYEPDNTYAQASDITLGEAQSHTLPAGDGDFVKFTLDARQDVVISTVSNFMRPALTLYTENHSQITSTTDSFSSTPTINEVLEAGTYFAYAFSQDGSAIGSYSIKIEATEPLAVGPQDLAVNIEVSTAVLTWNTLEGATSYNVYYGEQPGGPYTPYSGVATEGMPPLNTEQTTFSLNGIIPELFTYAIVRGVNAEGVETYPSNEVSFQIPLAQDEFEPDGTFMTASDLAAEPIYDGNIRQTHTGHVIADLDYVRFELTGWKSNLTITTSGPEPWNDTELYLYDEQHTQLAYNDQDYVAQNSYSRIEMTEVPAGVYYILARAWGDWSTIGTYFLDVKVEVVAAPSGEPDAFEEDNTIETITDSAAHVIEPTESQTHSIHQNGDVDFVRFDLESSADVIVESTATSSGLAIRLFDIHGTELANSTENENVNRLSQINLGAGTYYVSVANTAVPQFIASYDLSLTVYTYPEPPQNVVVTPGENTLAVSWDAVVPTTSYLVQYSYSAEEPFVTTVADEGASPLSTDQASFTLTGLPTAAHTFICVRAINGTAQSDCSEVVSATPLPASGD